MTPELSQRRLSHDQDPSSRFQDEPHNIRDPDRRDLQKLNRQVYYPRMVQLGRAEYPQVWISRFQDHASTDHGTWDYREFYDLELSSRCLDGIIQDGRGLRDPEPRGILGQFDHSPFHALDNEESHPEEIFKSKKVPMVIMGIKKIQAQPSKDCLYLALKSLKKSW